MTLPRSRQIPCLALPQESRRLAVGMRLPSLNKMTRVAETLQNCTLTVALTGGIIRPLAPGRLVPAAQAVGELVPCLSHCFVATRFMNPAHLEKSDHKTNLWAVYFPPGGKPERGLREET